jgi:kinetochore protein Spc7/SPC105
MTRDILAGAAELEATETDCSMHNPPVVREYLAASDEDRQLFEMTFKAYKAQTQLKARERWYAWKMSIMRRLGPDVESVWEGMKEVCFT